MEVRDKRICELSTLVVPAALLLASGGPAHGQVLDAYELPRYSLTAFGGYTFAGEFEDEDETVKAKMDDAAHFGLVFNVRESANTQWEVFWSRQRGEADIRDVAGSSGSVDLDVQYLHIGGTYVADGELARPFLAATVGVTRFDPDPLTFDSENFFSFGIGAGWQLRASPRLGFRLEGRLLGTFLRSDSALFCETGPEENICAIVADSDFYWELQTSLGVALRF